MDSYCGSMMDRGGALATVMYCVCYQTKPLQGATHGAANHCCVLAAAQHVTAATSLYNPCSSRLLQLKHCMVQAGCWLPAAALQASTGFSSARPERGACMSVEWQCGPLELCM